MVYSRHRRQSPERSVHRRRDHVSSERRHRSYHDSSRDFKRKRSFEESLSHKAKRDSRCNSRLENSISDAPSRKHENVKVVEKKSTVEDEIAFQKKVEEQIEKIEESDNLEKMREERRKKRQAILEKHKKRASENPLPSSDSCVGSAGNSPASSTTEGLEPPYLNNESETNQKHDKVNNEEDEDIFSWNGSLLDSNILSQKPEIETDEYGYCHVYPGEILGNRYKVIGTLGKGVFSHVLKAQDLETDQFVAIKVLREMDAIKRVGLKEVNTLKKIVGHDPCDQFHCIRYMTHFQDRDFLCIVTKLESHNLKEIIDKYGKTSGLPIKVIQVFARQLFKALHFMKKLEFIHADVKPVNLLLDENLNHLRLSDFGSIVAPHEITVSPELVTGLYRPPEVILGCPYNNAVDIWSAGCVLWEMVTGSMLFREGSFSNNTVLMKHMEIKGPIPKKMLKRGQLTSLHFDNDNTFLLEKQDNFSGNVYRVRKEIAQPTRNLKEELFANAKEEEKPKLLQFYHLLMRCLELDPNKRITAEEALQHPFFQ